MSVTLALLQPDSIEANIWIKDDDDRVFGLVLPEEMLVALAAQIVKYSNDD